MTTKNRYLMAAAAFSLCSALPFAAHAENTMSSADFKAQKASIEGDYKSSQARCGAMKGNAADVCSKEAKGNRDIALAELDQRNEPTPRHSQKVAEVKADAQYAVAKERCDDQAGNTKDVCVQEAKSTHDKALADAKLAKATADNRSDTRSVAREVASDKREADYKVAMQRCDSLGSDSKTACANDAKARFGM